MSSPFDGDPRRSEARRRVDAPCYELQPAIVLNRSTFRL